VRHGLVGNRHGRRHCKVLEPDLNFGNRCDDGVAGTTLGGANVNCVFRLRSVSETTDKPSWD
jgi:hypothetical protein